MQQDIPLENFKA